MYRSKGITLLSGYWNGVGLMISLFLFFEGTRCLRVCTYRHYLDYCQGGYFVTRGLCITKSHFVNESGGRVRRGMWCALNEVLGRSKGAEHLTQCV